MVVHPPSGRVIVGGNFNTLSGTTQLGMGSLDGTTGQVMPWAANQTIQNHDGSSAISSLTTDGGAIYGTGWAYFGGGATANFEGVFSADPMTGDINWIDGGRGDNYGIAVTGNVLYTVGHPHDWGMLGWNPQSDPLSYQRTMAIDKRGSPTPHQRVRHVRHLAALQGHARVAAPALAADPDRGDLHRPEPGGVERGDQR